MTRRRLFARAAFLSVALLASSSTLALRRCDDTQLPPDQRWNGAVSYSTPALDRFYDVAGEMSTAFKKADVVAAASLAREYLELARQFPCNWNYGNAIHDANVVLGLVALGQGRKAEAIVHLYAAAETPGSPQLDTFGPSLLLARDLANAGERKAAADYLRSIRRFWKAQDMSFIGMVYPAFADPDPLATWIKELNRGRVPDFDAPFHLNPP